MGDPGSGAPHLKYDTCVMNYDPDPASMRFCGRCILELRGWRDLPEGVEDLAACKDRLEQEIDGTEGSAVKAWKQMRRAFLASLAEARDQDEMATWITASLETWRGGGNPWNSALGLALLREAVAGYKEAGRDDEARQNWERLEQNTNRRMDLIDAQSNLLYP